MLMDFIKICLNVDDENTDISYEKYKIISVVIVYVAQLVYLGVKDELDPDVSVAEGILGVCLIFAVVIKLRNKKERELIEKGTIVTNIGLTNEMLLQWIAELAKNTTPKQILDSRGNHPVIDTTTTPFAYAPPVLTFTGDNQERFLNCYNNLPPPTPRSPIQITRIDTSDSINRETMRKDVVEQAQQLRSLSDTLIRTLDRAEPTEPIHV